MQKTQTNTNNTKTKLTETMNGARRQQKQNMYTQKKRQGNTDTY